MSTEKKVITAKAELQAKILVRLYSYVSKFLVNLGKFSVDVEDAFDAVWPAMYEALSNDKNIRGYGVLLPYEIHVKHHVSPRFCRYGNPDDFFFLNDEITFGRSVDGDRVVLNRDSTFRSIVSQFTDDPVLRCGRLPELGEFLDIVSQREYHRTAIISEIKEILRNRDERKMESELKKLKSASDSIGDLDLS